MALQADENREQVFKAGEGSGASGSFFFFTKDMKYLIKTLRGNELKIMTDMLDDYYTYISQN